jgi:hypothetical protein
VLAGGRGYSSAPSVVFEGTFEGDEQNQAKAVAHIGQDGQVVSVEMTSVCPGRQCWQKCYHGRRVGYTKPITVLFEGGGGEGASADASLAEDLFQVIQSRRDGRASLFSPSFIKPEPGFDNIARYSAEEMRGQMDELHRWHCSKDEKLVFHFTTLWALGLIFKGQGLRASCVGQLDGGVSVSLKSPADLNWEPFAGDGFREKVGQALWGTRYKRVLKGGEDADKLEFLICLRLPASHVADDARILPDRDAVYILPRTEEVLPLEDDAGWRYLPLSNILRVYCLVDLQAEAEHLEELAVAAAEKEVADAAAKEVAAAAAAKEAAAAAAKGCCLCGGRPA